MRRLARLPKAHSRFLPCSPAHSPSSTPSALPLSRRDLSTVSSRHESRPACTLRARGAASNSRLFSTSAATRKQDAATATETGELVETEEATASDIAAAIQTDLKVPGELRPAPAADEVDDPSYTPADSADGLEWVGGLKDWWEDDRHWGASKKYVGFARGDKVTEAPVLEVLARRAVVEALAVRQAAGEEALAAPWPAGGRDQLESTLGVGLEVQDGAAELKGDFQAVADSLTGQAEAAGEELSLSVDEARELARSWDQSWKQISLRDPRFKFAVTKRLQQLTGHMLSDSQLMHVSTVSSLIGVLVKPPKPKKLAEEVATKKGLTGLPNVKVYPRRVTPIDKEKMVGRWKVIERELEKRELPLTGTGGYGQAVEHKNWWGGRRAS